MAHSNIEHMDFKDVSELFYSDALSTVFLTLNIDIKGNITDPPGIVKPSNQYYPIYDALSRSGSIKSHFLVGADNHYADLPVWNLADKGSINHRQYHNSKPFENLGYASEFITDLPTVLMIVIRLDRERFIALFRRNGLMPNISLSDTGCIIYTDSNDIIRGFNENFPEMVDDKTVEASKFLGKNISEFITPSPTQIVREMLKKYQQPLFVNEECVYHAEGAQLSIAGNLSFTIPENVRECSSGILCSCSSDYDFTFLTISRKISTYDRIKLDIDFEVIKGASPVIFLTRTTNEASYKDNSPDSDGYQIGVTSSHLKYGIKRKSVLQTTGLAYHGGSKKSWLFSKVGPVFRLVEGKKPVLEYFDFESLESSDARLIIGIRKDSSVILKKIALFVSSNDLAHDAPLLTTVTIKSDPIKTAIITRINNVHLLTNFTDISAWLIEDITTIQNRIQRLQSENDKLKIAEKASGKGFVGNSPLVVKLKKMAQQVAETDATVLLEGATGTGKEVLAKQIHEMSKRRNKPFVKLDCAAITQSLLESELFGHEKGSFTGAFERKIGRFEQADGGTLFLDEVSNIPMNTQAKLLYFLQDRTIQRIGAKTSMRLNVRIIAASNIPLMQLAKKNLFREDLYYRLAVVSLALPSLSQRKDDIPLLCAHFLDEFNLLHNKSISGFTPRAFAYLTSRKWQGNVRELRNTIERAVIFCSGNLIDNSDLSFIDEILMENEIEPEEKYVQIKKKKTFNLSTFENILRESGGNIKATAQKLGIPRRTIYHKIKKLNMDIKNIRTTD